MLKLLMGLGLNVALDAMFFEETRVVVVLVASAVKAVPFLAISFWFTSDNEILSDDLTGYLPGREAVSSTWMWLLEGCKMCSLTKSLLSSPDPILVSFDFN